VIYTEVRAPSKALETIIARARQRVPLRLRGVRIVERSVPGAFGTVRDCGPRGHQVELDLPHDMPEALQEYVIIHELAHVELDHEATFDVLRVGLPPAVWRDVETLIEAQADALAYEWHPKAVRAFLRAYGDREEPYTPAWEAENAAAWERVEAALPAEVRKLLAAEHGKPAPAPRADVDALLAKRFRPE
jgi:hypothetical protein